LPLKNAQQWPGTRQSSRKATILHCTMRFAPAFSSSEVSAIARRPRPLTAGSARPARPNETHQHRRCLVHSPSLEYSAGPVARFFWISSHWAPRQTATSRLQPDQPMRWSPDI
jgi:hypothetical protein